MEPGNIAQWVALAVAVSTTIYQAVSLRSKAAAEKVSDLEKKTDAKFGEIEGKVADKSSVGRMGALEERVDKVEDRVSRAESRLEHMPDRESSHRLELAITRLDGRMETLDERVKPIAAMAQRVHERMFDEAGR